MTDAHGCIGCISTVLFYISTIAGAPDFYQGFVLRSAMFTFLASLLSCGLFVSILYASSFSQLFAFFLAVPVVVCLAAVRVNRHLQPFPLVAIVFTGFFLVSTNFDRTLAKATARQVVVDASIALFVALITQIPFPDLAHNEARRIVSEQIQTSGQALSNVCFRSSLSVVQSSRFRELLLEFVTFCHEDPATVAIKQPL